MEEITADAASMLSVKRAIWRYDVLVRHGTRWDSGKEDLARELMEYSSARSRVRQWRDFGTETDAR